MRICNVNVNIMYMLPEISNVKTPPEVNRPWHIAAFVSWRNQGTDSQIFGRGFWIFRTNVYILWELRSMSAGQIFVLEKLQII